MFSIMTSATSRTAITNTMTRLLCVLATIALTLTGTQALAAEPAPTINTLERSGLFGYKPSGVAIRGADAVAYFTEGKYVPGNDQFITEWNDAIWQFSSQQNLDLFIANPENYAPQYGGYCAYGVAEGDLVKIEPENWTIVDGELYLNFNNKIQKMWENDIPGYIAEADENFDDLLQSRSIETE